MKRISAEDKRLKILSVATDYFLNCGYDGCTLDQVAAGAKVGKQAIYEFFENKEELYSEVVRSNIVVQPLDDLPSDQPVHQVISDYILKMIHQNAGLPVYGMMRTNILAYRRLPALADSLHQSRRNGARPLQVYLEALQDQRKIDLHAMDPLNVATRIAGVATQGARAYMGFGWPDDDRRRDNAQWSTKLVLEGCDCHQGPVAQAKNVGDDLRSGERPPSMRLAKDRFDELCSTALLLFFEHGFDGMSIDHLVELTGVSRATIYRNFHDKDGFFRFVVEREVKRSSQSPLESGRGDGFEHGLQLLARQLMDGHAQDHNLAMYRLLIEEADRVPDLARAFYDGQIDRVIPPLTAIYQQYLGHPPCEKCVVAFHTLATFGVRFLTSAAPLSVDEKIKLSRETAKIMTLPLLRSH